MNTSPLRITNGTVLTEWAGGEVIPDGAVALEQDVVAAVGSAAEVERAFPDAPVLDARGGVIAPGLINLHHHFYSALARGCDPGIVPMGFADVLQGLWWRLDRALDRDTVRLSALLSLTDCVRAGCTTVFDHHASPAVIGGVLGVLADAAREAGVRASLCYEVSDRNGRAEAQAGLAENRRLIEAGHPGATMGLHASFTLSDETLAAAQEARGAAGIHIHVAEAPLDVSASLEVFGTGPIERLRVHELLDDHAIVVHGVHLDAQNLRALADTGATLVHCPESNANNAVGHLDLRQATDAGVRLALGTDGMASTMLRALRAAFLMHRHATGDPSSGFDLVPPLLGTNARVAAEAFGLPGLGTLAPGAPGDVIVLDAPPWTPLTDATALGHTVYALSEASVRHTVAGGHVLMRDFALQALDPVALAADARQQVPEMWRRLQEFPKATPFLG